MKLFNQSELVLGDTCLRCGLLFRPVTRMSYFPDEELSHHTSFASSSGGFLHRLALNLDHHHGWANNVHRFFLFVVYPRSAFLFARPRSPTPLEDINMQE